MRLRPVRAGVPAAYVAGGLAVYTPLGWGRLSEALSIPLLDCAAVFALAAIIGGILGLLRLLDGTPKEAGILSLRTGDESGIPGPAGSPEGRRRLHEESA